MERRPHGRVEVLRLFHHAVPAHEAVVVVLELKNTDPDWANLPFTTHNFSASHPMDALDRTLRDALPGAVFEPRELLARAGAPPGSTLARAVAAAGWPTIDALRGKFIFTVLGYWSSAAYDWARYGGEGDIAARACFPHRCIFDVAGSGTPGSWPGNLVETVPPAWLAAARENSVVWQVEELANPDVPAFLARGGIVRGHDSYTPAEQEDRVRGSSPRRRCRRWRRATPGRPRPACPAVRSGGAAAAIGGKVYVFGGNSGGCNNSQATLFIYDVGTDSWTTGAALPRTINKPAGPSSDSRSSSFASRSCATSEAASSVTPRTRAKKPRIGS